MSNNDGTESDFAFTPENADFLDILNKAASDAVIDDTDTLESNAKKEKPVEEPKKSEPVKESAYASSLIANNEPAQENNTQDLQAQRDALFKEMDEPTQPTASPNTPVPPPVPVTPVVTPEPTPTPVAQTPSTPQSTPLVTLTNTPVKTSDKDDIATIIRVVDAFRTLSITEQKQTAAFLSNSSRECSDAEVVQHVFNVDPMINDVMKHLTEAKKLEPVDRAFYIMDMNDQFMRTMGRLVETFYDNSLEWPENRTQYARILVQYIEDINNDSMRLISQIEKVLAAKQQQ